jgi:SAM-dependent methyltransferase
MNDFMHVATPLQYWLSDEGRSLLEAAHTAFSAAKYDTFRAGAALRKQFPNEQFPNEQFPNEQLPFAEAMELVVNRHKALQNLHLGDWVREGFFTRQSLEQATAPAIARHHAQRFAGCKHVLEICTGAGFDTAALAHVAERVTTIEADERLAAMARQNLLQQGVNNVQVVCGLAETVLPTLKTSHWQDLDGLWADPSRRTNTGERIENPDEYKPSLRVVQQCAERISHHCQAVHRQAVCGIKIAPALNCTAEQRTGWQREWVGTAHECREQVLWRGVGGMADGIADGMIALPELGFVWQPSREDHAHARLWNSPYPALAGQMLVEPHPCLIRSGHLSAFFAALDVCLLDEHIAFGVADDCAAPLAESPLYQRFRILEAFPFHRKTLRERLRQRSWGTRTEIKKRGFPETPEHIRSWLRLPSSPAFGVVVIARVGNGHLVMLAERI